jgi:hypothetical protein
VEARDGVGGAEVAEAGVAAGLGLLLTAVFLTDGLSGVFERGSGVFEYYNDKNEASEGWERLLERCDGERRYPTEKRQLRGMTVVCG